MNPSAFRTALAVIAICTPGSVLAADWPQWGGGPSRNAVSTEKGAPLDFAFLERDDKGKVVKPGRNIAWTAELGDWTVIPPVIADGLVWVGTNARNPDDDKIPDKDWDGGVLMCFRESDGKLLWRHRTPRLSGKGVKMTEDWPRAALGSAPLVEGDRLWYVNNRTEVVCLDIGPLKKGSGEPREVWKLDMRKELGVFPHLPLMQFGFAASVGGYKDRLYVVTHNGVSEDYETVPAPDAPSLVCLEKGTGKVLWKDSSPGKNILGHQLSSPLVVEVNGKAQVIVGQGDGWLRSFDAANGTLIWKCDLNPKEAVWKIGGESNRNYIIATPVLDDGRVYIATGLQAEYGAGPGNLYCIDPTGEGDVSRELDAGPRKGKPNPNSKVVWYTPWKVPADVPRIEVGKKKKRDLFREVRNSYFERTIASVTVHDGLVYAGELAGCVFCFDAKTGKLYWVEDTKACVWGQPLWVDGKVYVGTDGDLFVFAHGKQKKVLAKIETPQPLRSGPVFANGTLYLTGQTRLYAIRKPKGERP